MDLYRIVGFSLSVRSGLLEEFRRKLADLDQRDAAAKEGLKEVVPDELRDWVEDYCIVSSLFRHGRAEDKIYFPGHYGFDDFDDVQKKLKKLRAAWKDAVSIKWDGSSESGRIEVEFRALM